jgi:hypothetical protein
MRFSVQSIGGLGRNRGETEMAAWRRDAAWLVYRVRCRLPPCLNDAAHSEPTPRRIGLELGTYWGGEPSTKGVLPYGHFDQGIDDLSIIMVIRTSLSFVRYVCVLYLCLVCTNVMLPQIVIV